MIADLHRWRARHGHRPLDRDRKIRIILAMMRVPARLREAKKLELLSRGPEYIAAQFKISCHFLRVARSGER